MSVRAIVALTTVRGAELFARLAARLFWRGLLDARQTRTALRLARQLRKCGLRLALSKRSDGTNRHDF